MTTEWYTAVIKDPLSLPGRSICDVVSAFSQFLKIEYVVISGVEGANTSCLMGNSTELALKLDEFMRKASNVEQFDWGDFFLFCNFPADWPFFQKEKYIEIIPKAETTIRAVDDTYIYVYTLHKEVIDLIGRRFSINEIKKSAIYELEFPS